MQKPPLKSAFLEFVMEPGQSFTAKDFLKELRTAEVASSGSRVRLTGMVKEIEQNDEALAFDIEGQCKNWITVPLERIEKIEYLGESPCQDHTHPIAELTLRLEANFEASLLILLSRNSRTASSASCSPPSGLPIGARVPEHLIGAHGNEPADFGCGGGGVPSFVCNSGCACKFSDGYRCCANWCCMGLKGR